MKTVKYINSLGAEITFEQSYSAIFILKRFKPGTDVNNYSSKGSGQNGSKYVGSTLGEGTQVLQFAIKGSTKEEYSRYRKKLYQLFNPLLGEGYLIYNDGINEKKIKCIPEEIPFLVDLNSMTGQGEIELLCNDPFWMDMNQTKEEIALWVGDFEFDFNNGLQIPEEGIIMGHRELSLIVNCTNDGDGEAGMLIEFRALATLTNPSLRNVNTQEYVKIIKTMVAGEIIRVNTHFAEEDVEMELNGMTSNAFNYIDEDMTFLKLYQGDNLFRYDAETGLDNLVVNIYRQNKYLGV